MRGSTPITKEDFENLKVLDTVCGREGRNGPFWTVLAEFEDSRGKIVALRNSSSRTAFFCHWDDEKNQIVDASSGETLAIFQGHAYVQKESVNQVVEEMLHKGELSARQADRLLEACKNDTSSAIGDSHCD
jgi:hypothetical protein